MKDRNRSYEEMTHVYGRIWILSALGMIFAYPIAACIYYDAWPGIVPVLKGLIGVAPIFWTVGLIEVLTFVPMLGTAGSYLAFVTGNLTNLKVLVFAVAIVFVNVVLNAFVVYDLPADLPKFVNFIIIFYNVFGCILALIMLVSVTGQEELESELKIVENLLHKNEQIYELSKVNVDFINMKCHDLRHRIRNMRRREFMDEKELAKLIADVEKKMKKAASELNFEAAAELRDKMVDLKKTLEKIKE